MHLCKNGINYSKIGNVEKVGSANCQNLEKEKQLVELSKL